MDYVNLPRGVNNMNIAGYKISRLQIIIFGLLLIGIVAGVYLVQVQQIFKSKAAVNVNQAFEIKDDRGNIINCDGTNCYTNSEEVNIKLKDKSVLEQ